MREVRDVPKLEHYEPTKLMAPGSYYDKNKADRAVAFIEQLRHTKGRWAGKRFWLLPWQEKLIRDVFGTIAQNGYRQFREVYAECSKKMGKSELAAAIALLLLFLDNEPSAEIYGAASDRNQASLVFDVSCKQIEMCPELSRRSKILASQKKIVNIQNNGFYRVVSADYGRLQGLNASGIIFDEIMEQPNDKLYHTLLRGSGDARTQPLAFEITTAGFNKQSICYTLHCKAMDILKGKKVDPQFYPAVFSLDEEDDWRDEKNWYKSNPSLGITVPIETFRNAYNLALENPAEEAFFKTLRLNMWLNDTVAWIPDNVFMRGAKDIDIESLKGRDCYGGLDLSSTTDITALMLVFPPDDPNDPDQKYIVLPHFWLPRDTIDFRARRDKVPYRSWEQMGLFNVTEGNVIDYNAIEQKIIELGEIYHILEIGVDRWNATQLITNLQGDGFIMVPIGVGFKDQSAPSKEMYKLLMEGRIIHGGNPVLRWMAENAVVDTDAAGNIKVTKARSTEKVDGIIALVMGLDRAVRNEGRHSSVYDERGLITF